MMPLKILTSMASRELLQELCARFQGQSSHAVAIEAAGGVEVARRVRAAEFVDVVVLARNTIAELAREGVLLTDTITDIAHSGIYVAVADAAAAPDITSGDSLRSAVLAARSLSYSTGPSGVYLEKLFAAWGILEEIRPRILIPAPGVPVAGMVAAGKAEIGFQQLSELIHVPGIRVLGPLPAEMQLVTTFSGAAARASGSVEAGRELLRYLASPAAADIKPNFGMQHC